MPGVIVNCDWGTTQFRLRVVELEHFRVAAEFRSADGVASLAGQYAAHERPSRYRSILTSGIRQLAARLGDRLRDAPVVVSGMASSSLGWQEVAYARLPLSLDGSEFTWLEMDPVRSDLGSHRVMLISGARTDSDVMRGEETELTGLFTLPAAAGLATASLVIKPGTHSKHLHVANHKLVGLRTFMTGELFDVLGQHSILRHSLDDPASAGLRSAEALDDLRAGVRCGRTMPLAAALFQVRTRQLVEGVSGARNRAFLSGVLLGSELVDLLDPRVSGLPLVLCATDPLATHYATAINELGLGGRLTAIPADEVELLSARGQVAIWRKLVGSRDAC